jgi:hypothetical protein
MTSFMAETSSPLMFGYLLDLQEDMTVRTQVLAMQTLDDIVAIQSHYDPPHQQVDGKGKGLPTCQSLQAPWVHHSFENNSSDSEVATIS